MASGCSAPPEFLRLLGEVQQMKQVNERLVKEIQVIKCEQQRERNNHRQDIERLRRELSQLRQTSEQDVARCQEQISSLDARLMPVELGMLSDGNPQDAVDSASIAPAPKEYSITPASFWPHDYVSGCDADPVPVVHKHQTSFRGVFDDQPLEMISEEDLVGLVVQILLQHGNVPVGKVGSLLHKAANNHNLPSLLKERYGGLKKFIERHPDEFVLGADHPYNPKVSLRCGGTPTDEKADTPAKTTPTCGRRRRKPKDKALNGRDPIAEACVGSLFDGKGYSADDTAPCQLYFPS